jgi:thiol-disulfide isomerase/thioredoxin
MSITMIALMVPSVRADAKSTAEFEKLQKAYSEAMAAFEKQLDAATTNQEKQELQAKNPGPRFAEQFLAFAQRYPKEDLAYEALVTALGASGGPQNRGGCWARVTAALERDHVQREAIGKLVRDLAGSGDQGSVSLLQAIMAKNPRKKIQAKACKGLIQVQKELSEAAERLKDEEVRQAVEKARGKEYIAKLLAQGEAAEKAAAGLEKTLKSTYAGFYADLAIGKPAPEVISQDLQGKKVKLSDLRGKVVVLDIWATWCGPCKEMIPHERKLVARLKDQPFALVSISVDDEKETVQAFTQKNLMPWAHWWEGPDGALIDDWDVSYFPTIYVIDAKGVIRYKDVREKALDEAVEELVKEAKEKK